MDEPNEKDKGAKKNVYSTADVYLASFLQMRGLTLLGLELEGTGIADKFIFVFEETEERPELVKEFFSGGLVDASHFAAGIRNLKSLLWSHKKGQGRRGW